MKRKVTARQEEILRAVKKEGRLSRPRNTLEKLQKKGLVHGGRNEGWIITARGLQWLSLGNDK